MSMPQRSMKNAKNKKCHCDGTGQVSVCLLCEDNTPHSHCDDSFYITCVCFKKKNKTVLKGGTEHSENKLINSNR